MKMINMLKQKGFGLIEIIIALAVAAVLGTVGYASYHEHIVNANQEALAHDMVNMMTDFEKHYSKTGTYATKDARAPEVVIKGIKKLSDNSNYNVTCHPSSMCTPPQVQGMLKSGLKNDQPTTDPTNKQFVCIVAKPKDTNSGYKDIAVDSFGNVTRGYIPVDCGGDGPNPSPAPAPTNTSAPVPGGCSIDTPWTTDRECYCSFHKDDKLHCDGDNPQPPACTADTTFDTDIDCYCSFHKDDKAHCGGDNPPPPECTADTPLSTDRECYCSFHKDDERNCGSSTPTPEPSPTTTPEPSPYPPGPHGCERFIDPNTISWASDNSGQCNIDKKTKRANGNCQGKGVLGGCNGNCDRTVNYIIDGGDGANGNCSDCITAFPITSPRYGQNGNGDRSLICNGTVGNGNMHDVTIVAGPNMTASLLCNGNCDRAKLYANPRTKKPSHSNPICNGNCHQVQFHIPKAWGIDKIDDICNGHCDGSSINTY